MFAKNWFPNPSPFDAPFTKPAISTISIVVGTTRSGFTIDSNFSKRGSGTVIVPTFGSIVQKGKFALCAFAFDKQLNKVDLPTFGNPTIPHFRAMSYEFWCKDKNRLVIDECRLMNIRLTSLMFSVLKSPFNIPLYLRENSKGCYTSTLLLEHSHF